ncbi:MAG TPA: DUF1775 domain-containing protein [Ilumatobacteraceae bacterium]|nr:DUF1775 domain-containing protein [Ilumatobacteraceae bacterium]
MATIRATDVRAISTTRRDDKELHVTSKLFRCIGATTAGVVAGIVIAAVASAHVHVEVDGEAVAGQPAQLVFVVPNERDDAATVTIEVQMPQDTDLTDVVAAEIEGWTITTTTRGGDLVDTIQWDATGAALVGEESAELPVAVGPLPAVEFLTFPTVQTYDDGEIVRWIEPAPAGEPEPELPVPTLAITAAAPGDTAAPTEPPATDAPVPTEPSPTASTDATTPPGESLVIAPAPSDTDLVDDAAADATTEVTETPSTLGTDDDDGAAVWPWVVVIIVIVVVGGGVAIAIARRRTSG